MIVISIFLFSCGEDDVCPPPESTISLSPESLDITDAGPNQQIHTTYFTINVADNNGIPIKHAKLSISFIWAVPDSYQVVQLYDGDTPVNSPFNTETDEFGVYYLKVDFLSGGGLEYFGDVEVRACGIFGSATVTIAAETATQ